MTSAPGSALVVFSEPDPMPDAPSLSDRLLYAILGLLKPGYRHCFVMVRADAFKGWLVMHTHAARTEVLEMPDGMPVEAGGITHIDYGHFTAWMVERGLAKSVWCQRKELESWNPQGPLTCVSMVKHYLGVAAPGVLTPFQLYRLLEARQPQALVGVLQ